MLPQRGQSRHPVHADGNLIVVCLRGMRAGHVIMAGMRSRLPALGLFPREGPVSAKRSPHCHW